MLCGNCGKEVTENSRFCSECGAPIEVGPVVTETPAEEPAPVAETPAETVPAEDIPIREAVPGGKKGGKNILAIIGVTAVVLVLLVVGIVSLVSGGSKKATEIIGYVNEDYELMFLTDTKEKTTAVEISDEANSSSAFSVSPDEKYVYFREFDNPEYGSASDSTLMRMQISKIGKEGAKAEKVDSDVSAFRFLDNGNLFYTKRNSDRKYDVYIYDGKEKTKLVKNVDDYEVDEKEKYLYYTVIDETTTLYRVALNGNGEKEKLLKDADIIWSDYDAEILVYGEYNGGKGDYAGTTESYGNMNDCYTVYTCTPGGSDGKEVLDDAVSVFGVNTDGGKASFYYITRSCLSCTLYDFVTDTCSEEDLDVLDAGYPEYIEYPSYYHYEAYYLIGDGENGYTGYETGDGTEVPFEDGFVTTDWSEAAEVAIAMGEAKYEEAQREYAAAEEAYEEAAAVYEQARWRQGVREALQEWDYYAESFDLHKYEDGQSAQIAADVDYDNQYVSASKNGIFLYGKTDVQNGKVANIEDLNDAYEVYSMLEYGSDDEETVWYLNVGGAESEMTFDTKDVLYVNGIRVLNDKEVVLAVQDNKDTILEAYKIEKDGLTFSSILSDDYYSFSKYTINDKDVLYFYEDWDGEKREGDLVCYADGKREVIAKEIYRAYVLEDSGQIYTLSEMDTDRKGNTVCELSVKQGDDWVTISDECSPNILPTFLDAKQVLYMADGDLFLWNGKESRRIAKDVLYYWADSVAYRTIY